MSFSQNDGWVIAPKGEERAALAEYQRQIDQARAANERVPTFENADLSRGAPKSQVVSSRGVENVSLPAPSSATFYSKNSSVPRSGANVAADDIVEIEIPGMGRQKTSVANALNLGLIARDAAGGYRGLDAGERNDMNAQEQQEQQQERAEASAELEAMRATGDAADVDTSRVIDAVVRFVPGHAVASLAHDVMTNGTFSETGVARAAEAAGWTTEQGKRVASSLYEGLSRQAAVAVTSQGVPAAEVEAAYAWMAQVDPVAHKHATMGLILNSDATELKRLAKAYYRHRVIR